MAIFWHMPLDMDLQRLVGVPGGAKALKPLLDPPPRARAAQPVHAGQVQQVLTPGERQPAGEPLGHVARCAAGR